VLDLLFNCGPASLAVVRGQALPEGVGGYEHTRHRCASR
jgi:hypothetical protein